MSKKAIRTQPSLEYLQLALLNPELLHLWLHVDNWNRRHGNRSWLDTWYGYGKVPIGFKSQVEVLVGWGASSGADPALKTSDAYDTVYFELCDLLQRRKCAEVAQADRGVDLRIWRFSDDQAATAKAWVQSTIDTLYPSQAPEVASE